MFCPHCATQLPDGSKFCLSCGKPMPVMPATPAVPPVRPASPSAPQRPAALAWPPAAADRTAMPAAHERRQPLPPEPEPPSRAGPVIAAAVLALLLVGGGGMWLLHRSSGSSVAAVPAPQARDARSIGAPSLGPGISTGPSVMGGASARGGPGVPIAMPGASGPSVAGVSPGRSSNGPAVVGSPPGNGGPNVTGATGGPRTGPAVTAAPAGPGGPSVVQSPSRPNRGPDVTAATGGPKPGPSVVNTPENPKSGPSVAKAPERARSGPAVTSQPAAPRQTAPPQGMPQNILAYLDLVRRAEVDRHQYEDRLSNMLIRMIPNLMMPNFDDDKVQGLDPKMVRMYDQIARDYAVGTQRFQVLAGRIGVPPDCRVLHVNYSYALSRNPVMIMETARRLVAGDYAGLHRMLTTVGRDLDEKYATADGELSRLCGQYNVRKSFTIGDNGGGGGSILGF